jgi:hypothetical protein
MYSIALRTFRQGLAAQLTTDERRQILGFFTRTMDTLQQLETTKDKPYILEVFADIEAAVSNIFSNPPQYGLSKWASLQVAEKAKIPKHHDLHEIASRAQQNGLSPISAPLLDRIQCTPGVRYGEVVVNLEEAISAHSGALEVCRIVAPHLR